MSHYGGICAAVSSNDFRGNDWTGGRRVSAMPPRYCRLRKHGTEPPRRVSDGIRTRNPQDHNLMLYQLRYAHQLSRRSSRLKD